MGLPIFPHLPIHIPLYDKEHHAHNETKQRVHNPIIPRAPSPSARPHRRPNKIHSNKILPPFQSCDGSLRNILRRLHWIRLFQLLRNSRLPNVLLRKARRINAARKHRVDLHTITVQQDLLTQSIAQRAHRRFARRVRRVSHDRVERQGRRSEDQMPLVRAPRAGRRKPVLEDRVCHVRAGPVVDVHLAAQRFAAGVEEQLGVAGTGHAPHYVGSSAMIPGRHLSDNARGFGCGCEIGGKILEGLFWGGGAGFDYSEGFFELADVAGDYADVGTLCGELFCDGQAHARGGTSEEDGLGVISWRLQ
jgi:hypothetical protein